MRLKISILFVLFTPIFLFAQNNISEARTFSEGDTVTILGIVLNGSEMGTVRYLQDNTAAIACYPGTGSVTFKPLRGDSVTVTGVLTDYKGLLEISPILNYNLISSSNSLPDAKTITPNQISESLEGQLIKIKNSTFLDRCISFSDNGGYYFTSSGEIGYIYNRNGSSLTDGAIPDGKLDISGIISQYTSSNPADDGYQLLFRDEEDINESKNLYFTTCVTQSNSSTDGFDLNWTTNAASSTFAKYGKTESLELGVVSSQSGVTSHSLSFTGLDAGSIYYVKPFVVSGSDTSWSGLKYYITSSNSTGDIRVYFNHPVDTSEAKGKYAQYLDETFDDTIVAYINRAKQTLDYAVYNTNWDPIIEALNSAYSRGVKIRCINEPSTANTAFNIINNNIPVLQRTVNAGSGIMHNKFLVIDVGLENDSYVLTGSTNFTDNNLFDDFNNMVIIQDQAVARAYELEFEEMWGDTGLIPDSTNALFGSNKTDNTQHEFIAGGKKVEVYFSPSDNLTDVISEKIATTDNTLEFALLSFTKNELGTAVVNANSKIAVRAIGIIESGTESGSEFSFLQSSGVEVYEHDTTYDIHHKYAIIDQNDFNSDPMVITGSHNWSNAAENDNDENTIIIHDSTIANLFYQEFSQRYFELTGNKIPVWNSVSDNQLKKSNLKVYPNPCKDYLFFDLKNNMFTTMNYKILDVTGRTVMNGWVNTHTVNTINVAEIENGVYLLKIADEHYSFGYIFTKFN